MLTKKELKIKYKNLDRREKLMIGQALIKVNLGVANPQEQKAVAGFLKGSRFIAKARHLDELIETIHADEDVGEVTDKGRIASTPREIPEDELAEYEEDMVATESDLGEKINKK